MILVAAMNRANRFAKTIRDPVHGDIQVFEPDVPLLDTPQMQRLRGVKQLGSALHVYPGAQHSRWEHSLGTYHMAGEILAAVRENHRRDPETCRDVSPREAEIIRAVALLHDVTHIPHGHALEDQDDFFPRHDQAGILRRAVEEGELGKALARRRLARPVADHITEASARKSKHPYLSLVANGPVGADMLDYLRRDAYYTGLRLTYDDRILQSIKIDPRTGVVYVDLVKHDMDREDILTEILNLLRCRYVSSERIYYHHAKLGSGALISRAVELAVRNGLTREEISATTDEGLLDHLERRESGDAGRSIRNLLDRYRNRRLLKRCFVVSRKGNEAVQDTLVRDLGKNRSLRRELEGEIARVLRIDDPAEVIVYCPPKHMQLKAAAVPVRRAGKRIRPLTDYSEEFPGLGQMVEAYRNLWKLYVFLPLRDREARVRAGKKVEKILAGRFPGIKNQYKP